MAKQMPGYTRRRGSLTVPHERKSYEWQYSALADGTSVPWTDSGTLDNAIERFSYIEDYFEPFGRGIWKYKPVYHVKSSEVWYPLHFTPRRSCSDCPRDCNATFSGTVVGNSADPLTGDTGLFPMPDTSSWEPEIPAEKWQHLQHKLESRLPSIRGQAPDLFVFLVELADISSVLSLASKDLRRLLTLNGGGGLDSPWKTILDEASEHHLTWSFAIAPTIRDIEGAIKNLANLHNRLIALFEGLGKVHDLATSLDWSETDSAVHYGYQPGFCFWGTCGKQDSLKVTRMSKDWRIGVTMKYRYSLPDYLLKALDDVRWVYPIGAGLVPNMESLWELIPFSFVLDWVFNTDRLFMKYRNMLRPEDVKVDIIDMCVSISEKARREIAFIAPCLYSKDKNLIKEQTYSRYIRHVGEEALYQYLPWFKTPGFMQMALGASLLWLVGLSRRKLR